MLQGPIREDPELAEQERQAAITKLVELTEPHRPHCPSWCEGDHEDGPADDGRWPHRRTTMDLPGIWITAESRESAGGTDHGVFLDVVRPELTGTAADLLSATEAREIAAALMKAADLVDNIARLTSGTGPTLARC